MASLDDVIKFLFFRFTDVGELSLVDLFKRLLVLPLQVEFVSAYFLWSICESASLEINRQAKSLWLTTTTSYLINTQHIFANKDSLENSAESDMNEL